MSFVLSVGVGVGNNGIVKDIFLPRPDVQKVANFTNIPINVKFADSGKKYERDLPLLPLCLVEQGLGGVLYSTGGQQQLGFMGEETMETVLLIQAIDISTALFSL